jgi:teichoic acid glycerol-phosphate primase
MSAATLIFGSSGHHLDHLAPLNALFNIPLVVTDHQIAEDAHTYYPQIVVETYTPVIAPAEMIRRYEIIISCYNKDLIEQTFSLQKQTQNRPLLSIWCPHGNSDKGRASPFMEALYGEDLVLHYGEKMLDFIREKNAYSDNCHYLSTGNYRLTYYESMKPFYQKLLTNKVIRHLSRRSMNLLYAPTWNDSEQNSSLLELLPKLAKNLPADVNLIVKIHPNELLRLDTALLRLILSYEDQEGIFFLKNFPPIYPLLDFVDAYIGDMSSIGYDFLYFNKPMFFANTDKFPLQECGKTVTKLYSDLDRYFEGDRETFGEKRENLYTYVFDKTQNTGSLWKAILSAHEKWKNQTISTLPEQQQL